MMLKSKPLYHRYLISSIWTRRETYTSVILTCQTVTYVRVIILQYIYHNRGQAYIVVGRQFKNFERLMLANNTIELNNVARFLFYAFKKKGFDFF